MFYQKFDEQLYIEVQRLIIGNYDMYRNFINLSADFVFKALHDTVGEFLAQKKDTDKNIIMDELIKESYIQIFNNIGNLREPRAFYMWAAKIIAGVALRYIQKDKFEIISFEDEESNKNIKFDKASDDREGFIVKNIIEDRSKLLVIYRKLMELSELHRIVVQYFYYANMSIKEISVAMNCSEGAVKSKINDIRNAIKAVSGTTSANDDEPTKEMKSLGEIPLVWMAFRESIVTYPDKVAIQRAHYIGEVVGANATATGISDDAVRAINKSLGIKEPISTSRVLETPPKKGSGKKILCIIAVIVLMLVAGGAFGIWLKSREKNNKKTDKATTEVTSEEDVSSDDNALETDDENSPGGDAMEESTEEVTTEDDSQLLEEHGTEEQTPEESTPNDGDEESEQAGTPNNAEDDTTEESSDTEENATTESTTTEEVPSAGEEGLGGASND